MKQKIMICLVVVTAFFTFSTLQAQGWDKTFTSPLGDTTFANSVIETPDSGFVFAGTSFIRRLPDGYKASRPFVAKTDKSGNVIWRYTPNNILVSDTIKVLRTADGGFIILTTEISRLLLSVPSVLVIKLNNSGIELSRKYYLSGNSFSDAAITPELDKLVITTNEKDSTGYFIKKSNLLYLYANGDTVKSRSYNQDLGSITLGGDGQIYAVRGQRSYQSSVIKYSFDGDSLWNSQIFPYSSYVKRANDGKILVNGYFKLDYDGRTIWSNQQGAADNPNFSFYKNTNKIAILNPNIVANGAFSWHFMTHDSVGREISRRYFQEKNYEFKDLVATSDGGFIAVGTYRAPFSSVFNARACLIKLNGNGSIYSNLLGGKLFIDSIQNCRVDALEKGYVNRLISVESSNGTRYTVTDSVGNYQMQIDTGNYTIRGVLPNQNWRFCTPSVSKQISAANPTDTVNFALQALVNCPQMRISASTLGLRRCFDNNYYQIRYTNEGTQAAQNAFITLKLDSLLEYVSASRPLSSRSGQTLRFNLGTVPIGFDAQFSVQFRVKCGDSTRLGQSLCTEARIFPDTICIPTPNWSGANIVVSGRCDRDSVRFLVQNIGTGASSNLRRQIVEDEIVFLNGIINVPASGNRTISVPANGKTWRLNVDQEPNNPLSNRPTAVVEGCRTSPNQPISTGFVNQFPTDDGSPTVDNVCTPIVGAYDPNDKEGLPLGYKTARFIEQNQAIDYRIRFQNTGNDTAFTVVLRDTLSDFLDISSLKVGASSHKYIWSIEGKNVLVFRFDDIKLVDSFRNAAASQGFVAFKINQKKDVALGSKINNLADIYFDYNAPIRTNKTLHTVGKDFIVSVLQINSNIKDVKINVFPNPFSAQATIGIQDFDKKGPLSILSHFTLFDAFGRQLRNEKFEGNQYTFERQDLGAGVYFFKIENGGKLIGTGKFLVR